MSAGEGPTQEPTEHADFQEDPRVVSDLVIDSYKPLQVRSWFRFLYSPRRRLKRELEAAVGKASENERVCIFRAPVPRRAGRQSGL